MSLFDRAYEIAAAATVRAPVDGLAHPFGLAEPDQPLAWRVSEDVWTRLWDEASAWTHVRGTVQDYLLGFPLHIDFGLPSNSMLLEPIACPDSCQPTDAKRGLSVGGTAYRIRHPSCSEIPFVSETGGFSCGRVG